MPEIFEITNEFDYSVDPDLITMLLASDASGSGLANPQVMYDGWF